MVLIIWVSQCSISIPVESVRNRQFLSMFVLNQYFLKKLFSTQASMILTEVAFAIAEVAIFREKKKIAKYFLKF